MYSLIVSHILAFLYNQFPELSYSQTETLYSLKTNSLLSLPQPLPTTIVFSISMNFTALLYVPHINGIRQYVPFYFYRCLISISTKSSRFIHGLTYVSISCLSIAEWYCIVCTYPMLCIHEFVDARLGCFHLLAVVNNAAMSMSIHISHQDI